jgi:hypothetical protein
MADLYVLPSVSNHSASRARGRPTGHAGHRERAVRREGGPPRRAPRSTSGTRARPPTSSSARCSVANARELATRQALSLPLRHLGRRREKLGTLYRDLATVPINEFRVQILKDAAERRL